MSKAAPSKKGPAGKSAAQASEDALPDRQAVLDLFAPVAAFMRDPERERTRRFIDRLAEAPPQVLLLEGGDAAERLAAAHYLALVLNCDPDDARTAGREPSGTLPEMAGLPGLSVLPGLPGLPLAVASSAPAAAKTASAASEQGASEGSEQKEPDQTAPGQRPCLACPSCTRMISHQHRDCFFLDGSAGSIKIDEVRALREVLGEAPREARQRVVIFREAQALVEAAANALLKSLEEPRPATTFMLLTPQRERLLPTLVSRSFCLTLPWPDRMSQEEADTILPWEATLCAFLTTGRGLFELSGSKGAVDAPLTQAVISLCQRALRASILARHGAGEAKEGLAQLFGRLPEARLRMVDEALSECQDSLLYNVNPALVLEWLATRLFLLLPKNPARMS